MKLSIIVSIASTTIVIVKKALLLRTANKVTGSNWGQVKNDRYKIKARASIWTNTVYAE